MKAGDLVRYYKPSVGRIPIGLVIAVDQDINPRLPYRVRWSDHTDSERDWYAEEELTRINLTQRLE